MGALCHALRGQGLGLAVSVLWWFGLGAIGSWVLLRTTFGNWIFGIGGDAPAARNVGVPVDRVKILLFMATAAAARCWRRSPCSTPASADVLRGTLLSSRPSSPPSSAGYLLTGGYGSAIGAVLGALIFGMVNQGIVFAGVDADWFQVFLGAMLLTAVLVNNLSATARRSADDDADSRFIEVGHLQIFRARDRPQGHLHDRLRRRGHVPAGRQRRREVAP